VRRENLSNLKGACYAGEQHSALDGHFRSPHFVGDVVSALAGRRVCSSEEVTSDEEQNRMLLPLGRRTAPRLLAGACQRPGGKAIFVCRGDV
jgi:hypothetical protein